VFSAQYTLLQQKHRLSFSETAPINDRIDDTRGVATTNVPQLRTNAAPAKIEK
jgi:hypothetical protein